MDAIPGKIEKLGVRPPLLEVLSSFSKDAYALRNRLGAAVFGTTKNVYVIFGTGYHLARYLRGLTISNEFQPISINVLPPEVVTSSDPGGIEQYLIDKATTAFKIPLQSRELLVFQEKFAPSTL